MAEQGNAAAMRLCDELIQAAYDADICSPGDLAQRVRKIQAAIGPSPQGNPAALREALEECMKFTCNSCYERFCEEDVEEEDGICHCSPCNVIIKARAALASQPRNCDVGTAEEQSVRMAEFCRAQYEKSDGVLLCSRCQFNGRDCQFAWAQMPYEEGGAE